MKFDGNRIQTRLIETEEGFVLIQGGISQGTCTRSAYFLVDTGASHSLFATETPRGNKVMMIATTFNGTMPAHMGMVSLMVANVGVNINGYLVQQDQFPKIDGYRIAGILGTDFLLANKVTLDFNKGLFHLHFTHHNAPIVTNYYSMELGLNSYKVPVLVLENSGICFFFIVDSGANNNMIDADSLDLMQNVTQNDAGQFHISSLSSSTLATEYSISFKLHSAVHAQPIQDSFVCTNFGANLLVANHDLFRINGVMGQPFLRKHKVILDYHRKIFYSYDDFRC